MGRWNRNYDDDDVAPAEDDCDIFTDIRRSKNSMMIAMDPEWNFFTTTRMNIMRVMMI